MLKAHGISRPGALAGGDSAPTTPTKRKAKAEGAGSAKKKSTRGKAKKESDEDEGAETEAKPKPKRGKQSGKVKKEEDSDSGESRDSSLTGTFKRPFFASAHQLNTSNRASRRLRGGQLLEQSKATNT